MPKIRFSILVPNYGFNPYFFDCFESIMDQENDGSFSYETILCDQSPIDTFSKIKQELDEKYNNRIDILHNDVPSLFVARRSLIKKATGDYIVFIDSDDYISNDFLLTATKLLTTARFPDVLIHNLVFTFENGLEKHDKNLIKNDLESHLMDYFMFTSVINSVSVKIFKRKLYDATDYDDYSVINGEDKVFSFPLMQKAESIKYVASFRKYYYRQLDESMVHNLSYETARKALILFLDKIRDLKMNQFQKELLLEDKLGFFIDSLKKLFKRKQISILQYSVYFAQMKSIISDFSLYFSSRLSRKRKIAYSLISHNCKFLLRIVIKFFVK